MLPGQGKFGIIISRIPVMQSGLKAIVGEHLPDYELSFCRSQDELTLLQLRRAVLVIAYLSGEIEHPRNICEHYYSLMTQYRDIHWVFMVGNACFPLAVQLLMRPESTLISDSEPVKRLIEVVRAGGLAAERISQTLFSPEVERIDEEPQKLVILTLSERKVLRLLAKGWGINQIAALLKKSNKTISAQKNSAMRRLSLRSNAEMYAWINSAQGMKELNIYSAYGDQTEWKKTSQQDMSLS
ncbi:helix-turn-helix transcriptional regulator [Klebsiella michiganensis]|uniref:helix-turn-helix transcriptional regulator n=1 Tax=Klebsiella michiganensis TaxID=1134687 RepID=UPI002541D056|nr:LuxR C-terminal-related transcriptional regulator [Klebsiella michiganensis]MDK3050252.1 LuxR C-terminal-related transcriptional regulator [Klebsiella michiganensis]